MPTNGIDKPITPGMLPVNHLSASGLARSRKIGFGSDLTDVPPTAVVLWVGQDSEDNHAEHPSLILDVSNSKEDEVHCRYFSELMRFADTIRIVGTELDDEYTRTEPDQDTVMAYSGNWRNWPQNSRRNVSDAWFAATKKKCGYQTMPMG